MAQRFTQTLEHPELDGMPERRPIKQQVLRPGDKIDGEDVSISGAMTVRQLDDLPPLALKQRVTITVANADGKVIAFADDAHILSEGTRIVNNSDTGELTIRTWKVKVD